MGIGMVLLFIVLFIALISLARAARIVSQYEKGLVLRLGKYKATADSGLTFLVPVIEDMIKVDMRERVINVEPQKVITKDNVSVIVDAVIYYRIVDPVKSTFEVQNFGYAATTLAQTNLRNLIGDKSLDDTLTARDMINTNLLVTAVARVLFIAFFVLDHATLMKGRDTQPATKEARKMGGVDWAWFFAKEALFICLGFVHLLFTIAIVGYSLMLIGSHVEGMERRAQGAAPGDNSDELSIDAVCPKSALLIVRKDGDEDGRFTTISKAGKIPLILFEKYLELKDVLKNVYGK